MSESRRFKVGINERIIGKPGATDPVNYATQWLRRELTLAEFIDHVRRPWYVYPSGEVSGYAKNSRRDRIGRVALGAAARWRFAAHMH